MMNAVLQNLDRLQIELANIDPARDLDAADLVADMAKRLRDTLRAPARDGKLTKRLSQLRRIDQVVSRAG